MSQGWHGACWTRRFVRVALATSLAGLLLIPTAGSAAAHARLEASDPAAGTVLTAQPPTVSLTFNEPVEVNDGVIEVFDDRFNRVDSGHVTAIGQGRTRLQIGLRPGLARGTYTVSWHASSGDTHPVSGSFRFSLGELSVVSGTVPGGGRNDVAGVMLGALRWMGYLGLVLGPGVLLVALALWPAAVADRRTRRLALAGLSLLAVSTLGAMLLQGVWASGQPFSALWTTPERLDTHSRRFDAVFAVRSFLLVGFTVALVVALSRSVRLPKRSSRPVTRSSRLVAGSSRLVLGGTTVSTVALLATWPLVGHSAIGDASALAISVNLVHTFAMTVWLGGLVLIVVGMRGERAADLAVVLPRFSRLALAAVATLVATGTFMTWREVGSLNALTATTYGRVLLVKLVGVLILILLGNLARLWVRGYLSGGIRGRAAVAPPPGGELVVPGQDAALWRGLLAETTIALGVLALTAALVVIVPAR